VGVETLSETVDSGIGRLTPTAIRSAAFRRVAFGRGLDERHVQEFLGEVEREVVRLLNERAALAEEVDRLRRRVMDTPDGEQGALGPRPEDAHVQSVRILAKAQQTADMYVADAETYSRRIAEEARQARETILADAKSRAMVLVEEAHSRAAAAADAVPRPPDGRRDAANELAYLRTFSDVYRTHLRAYLEALIRNVDEWEKAEQRSITQMPPPTLPHP
jgi:DivIVA domain-containing protein